MDSPVNFSKALQTLVAGFFFDCCGGFFGDVYASPHEKVLRVPSLRGAPVHSLALDGDAIWIGTDLAGKARLFRMNRVDLSLRDESRRFRTKAEDTITTLFIDGQNLWIGSNHNTWLTKPFRRSGKAVGSEEAGSFLKNWLSKYDDLAPRCGKSSLETFMEEPGIAWLAYFKGSLYRYERASGRCTEVFRPPSIYQWPAVIAADRRFVYVGTRGSALVVVDRRSLRTTEVTEASLSETRFINAMACDNGHLWIGTDYGLTRIQKDWFHERLEVDRSR